MFMKKVILLILSIFILVSCWSSNTNFKNEAFYSFDNSKSIIEVISYSWSTAEEIKEHWEKVLLNNSRQSVFNYYYEAWKQDKYYLFLENANWLPSFSEAQMFIEEKRKEYPYNYIAMKTIWWEYMFFDCSIEWECN